MLQKFFKWYESYYALNVGAAAFLFSLQLIHLYWLTADVVVFRFLAKSYFELTGIWRVLIVLIDYTEIPAIAATSLVYVNELRKSFSAKSLWFLLFINSQWLHILWITDEFVVEQLTGAGAAIFPAWLAWLAISIDYLELPVIFDTSRKFYGEVKNKLAYALSPSPNRGSEQSKPRNKRN